MEAGKKDFSAHHGMARMKMGIPWPQGYIYSELRQAWGSQKLEDWF